ncbi:MAG: FoF1 ATP synthase subunit delta/epsilon [Tannerella sp.]|uniref:FoF1 ATP synthase subunit delta/epsilon n=1 Tax=Tannerella sp. TaxID=2382127 RepID=UPI003FA2BDCE
MLKIRMISPSGIVYQGECSRIVFPGEVGRFEVLPKHAPIISSLVEGEIECYVASGGEARRIAIRSGFVEVKANRITACVEI